VKKRSNKTGIAGKRSRKEQTNGRAEEEWGLPLMLDREELVAMLEERLTEFATDIGLQVACLLFDQQVNMSCKRATSGRSRPGHRLSVSARTR
jgi:hypothetical protein